jgi:hypothetical protein
VQRERPVQAAAPVSAVPRGPPEGAAVQRERPVQAAAPVSAVPRGPPEGAAVQHGQPAAVVMADARPVGTVTVVSHGRSDEGAALRE